MDHALAEQEKFNQGLAEIDLSSRRTVDVFKAEYGMILKAYTDSLRLKEAQTDTKVIGIAYQVGFGSLTAFYSIFEKETGKTPIEYRKEGMRHESLRSLSVPL